MANDLLADLTEAQREAVQHMDGPLLILAGAGSGKTRVITRRVAWLLQQGVHPGNILAITFTNKAAGEMKQRVEALVPGSRVWMSTFHSFGARILRLYADEIGIDRNFTIYDQADRAKVVKVAIEDLGVEKSRFTPDTLAGAISKAKNQLQSPERYARTANDFFAQTVAAIYPIYEKRLRDANAFDFDDLLYWPAMALKNLPELREMLDSRFRYVLIDEYQDTNQAQYAIARALSIDRPNLCVVGDPNQCLPPDTLVATPDGPRRIDSLKIGDPVLSGTGWGHAAPIPIENVMVSPFQGRLVRITLEDGTVLRATPNHICFGLPQPNPPGPPSIKGRGVTPLCSPLPFREGGPGGLGRAWTEPDADLRFTAATTFITLRADHIQSGMELPVLDGDCVVERRVLSVEREEYAGPVYDLTVPHTHNFIAGGVVVHNSIYRFRGSDITNILNFERDFPNARVLSLGKNYRSTKAILRAASSVIEHNTQRKPLELSTDNAEGEPVTVLTFEASQEEAAGIAKRIRKAVEDKQYTYRDFAVFMRVNALSRALEQAFVKERVPYQIVKGLAFFERKENKDILAYLRLLVNPKDDISFERVVNEPPRGVGATSLKHLKDYAGPREMSLLAAAADAAKVTAIKGKAVKALTAFAKMVYDLQGFLHATPDELIRQVLDKTGYRDMLKESKDTEDEDRLANIEELITAAAQFAQEDNSRTIRDFLENITLASDVDGWDEQADHVSIMTLHASKGLEFPVVFIVALEQGLLPHERSLGNLPELEEERRLAFVGMTRAKQELYLCHARIRDFRGQSLYAVPSMFLGELPTDEVRHVDQATREHDPLGQWRSGGFAAFEGWTEAGVRPIPLPVPPRHKAGEGDADSERYREGMLVKHAQYGVGRIFEVAGQGARRRLRIRFAKAGDRTFFASMVTLEVLPDPDD